MGSKAPEGVPLVAEWNHGKSQVQFSVAGATVCDPQPIGVAFSTVAEQGQAMAEIGKAIIDAVSNQKLKLFDIRFTTQPMVMQKKPSAFSAWLSGVQLVCLDFEAIVGQLPLRHEWMPVLSKP